MLPTAPIPSCFWLPTNCKWLSNSHGYCLESRPFGGRLADWILHSAWHVNTALEPLDVEKIKNATPEKKSKQLAEAYEIAAQGHDLQYFQDMLEDHKKALNAELEDEVDEDEVKKPAKEKGKRKSKAEVDEDGDVVMQDDGDANEDGDKKSKPSKKRKKDVDSEGEALKVFADACLFCH